MSKKYVSLEKLGLYDQKIKTLISEADEAALGTAKAYADSLASNYDAAGSAASAEAAAKSYTDTEVAKANAAAATAQAAAEAAAAAAATADGKAVTAQGEVDALETYVGTIPSGSTATSIVAYVQEKTSGIATEGAMTELGNRVTAVEGDVATIKGDYLTSVEEAALEGKIALKADQTALDAVSLVANAAATQTALQGEIDRAKGEEARIEGLVTAEAQRAAGAESGLNERLEEVEAFFKLAEGETLDTALDTLKEIQTYITGEGAAADQMVLDIAANAKAIEDMDAAYKAADVTLQGNIDKKADASTVEAIDGRVGALETASATHATKTEVQAVSDALSAYDTAHAGDYTNAQIDAAIKVNTDAIAKLNDTYATDAELASAIEAEVTRANGAYAAKSLETTVATHVADTVAHVTADDKTKWNAALQASDITTGAANGAIAVKGADVVVKGLGSAAFTEASAYDVAGSAAAVQGKLDEEIARAKAAEKVNADAIAAFVECSEEDINDLFKA